MTLSKALAIGSLCLVITGLYPQKVWASVFNNQDFLDMPPLQQNLFLKGAMETLGQVAAFKNKETGQCVYDWYFSDKMSERNWLILESMKKYPDHTPTAILIALTQRTCGVYLEVM